MTLSATTDIPALKGKHLIEPSAAKPISNLSENAAEALSIGFARYTLNEEAFQAYLTEIQYPKHHPKYVEEFGGPPVPTFWERMLLPIFPNLPRRQAPPRQPPGVLEGKYAEHYVSFELCGLAALSKDARIVDVAASNSPVQSILHRMGYEDTYKTDLNYKTKEEQKVVGANANDLSYFAENSVDLIVSHNSWEHFEGASDIEFLSEAARILKPGGALCIIPIVLTEPTGVNHTDPTVWASKYRNESSDPIFDDAFPIAIGTHKQRLMKFYNLTELDKRLSGIPLSFTLYELENCKRGNRFALLAKK